jgi:dihydrofolate reductase
MRIVISAFISLDGVVQAPGGPDEDTDGGFAHGGWSMPFFDPEAMPAMLADAMSTTEALLFGRRTWRVMADAWPARAGDPFADHMNSIPKYVASRTLTEADIDWTNTTLLRGEDALDHIAALRATQGGDLGVMGSSDLVRQLVGAGLFDELRLMIEPVILGGGKRLFPDDGTARTLELVTSSTTHTGVQLCVLRPVSDDIATGSSDELYT